MPEKLVQTAVTIALLLAVLNPGSAAPPEPPAAVPSAQPGVDVPPQATAKSRPVKAALKRPAPDFRLPDTEGREVSLRSLRGKLVVLEWFNPDCPFVRYAHGPGPLREMAKRYQSEQLVWLAINSSAPGKQGHGAERNRAAKDEFAMPNPILLDESGAVGRSYGAEKTPHLFVIDKNGVLVYRGGLDNAPMGVVDETRPHSAGQAAAALEPYLENALADVQRQRAPRVAETPAYGCGVKYQMP
jgi:peroxiredoxin